MSSTLTLESLSHKYEKIECTCGEMISRTNISKHQGTDNHDINMKYKSIVEQEPMEGDLYTKEMKAMLFLIANICHPEPRNKGQVVAYKKAVVFVGNEIERLFLLYNQTKDANTNPTKYSLEYWLEQLMSNEDENQTETNDEEV